MMACMMVARVREVGSALLVRIIRVCTVAEAAMAI